MYFSQNKKASQRRANDEYLRRSSFGAPQNAESLPTASSPPDAPREEQTSTCPICPNEIAAPSLAMVYSPKQCFKNLYEPEAALSHGTLFVELDLPFEGRSVTKR